MPAKTTQKRTARTQQSVQRKAPKAGDNPVAREKPLHEQFQRIGGGLTPVEVSHILQQADSGQPARLLDLFNESRQKDGHLQGICYTREIAVSKLDLELVIPEKPSRKEKKAEKVCRQILEEFEGWPQLIEHLTGSFTPGHATSQLFWTEREGMLIPVRAGHLPARDFIFERTTGQLRYATRPGDTTGVDLLEQFPGRIIQVRRRITGDVPVREGLVRVLVWGALFRNWTFRDWIALGEVGWKPWRIGKFTKNASKQDKNSLVDLLERIGSQGIGVIPESVELQVEWPKGMAPGTGGSGTHHQLFQTCGFEMSKAVLGQTTTIEPGANGDRASTETRDRVRSDIREADAVAVAAALRAHLFAPAVAANVGADVRVPVPWFATEESVDQLSFAQAVEKLKTAGVRIPAKWVRDEVGMPEPKEGEEILGGSEDDDEDQDDGDQKPDSEGSEDA